MVAVGLWAGVNGGRAVWAWPVAFVGVMLVGGALGMMGVALPAVEPGILASVIVLGLLVLTAARVPVVLGAPLVGVFAMLHGHAHGAELPAAAAAISYSAGFALATALLHAAGLGIAFLSAREGGSAAGARRRRPGRRLRRRPGGHLRRQRMIPGEIITVAGDIELNAGRAGRHADGRQHRRPADPGRLALPFRRDQSGPAVRPRQGARAAASTSPPAPPCASSRARRARSAWWPFAGSRRVFGFRQAVMGDLD